MDKIIRNIDEKLWRSAKAHASLSGKSLKQWVEEAIAQAILQQDKIEHSTQEKICIGTAISTTGPYSTGAKITQIPNYIMWVEEVNARGGIYVKEYAKQLPVELIQYNDRSDTSYAVKLVEKLILEDKVDLLLPPWGTAMHMAVAPIANKFKYPLIGPTTSAEKLRELAPTMPYFFGLLNMPRDQSKALVDLCKELGVKKAAIIYVNERHGIEWTGQLAPNLEVSGIELVMFKSYPPAIKDVTPLLKKIKTANADAFIAISYPNDTFLILKQAMEIDFNPKFFYCGVGAAYPPDGSIFTKERLEGVCGSGAWNPKVPYPGAREYFQKHLKRWGREPDRWGSAFVYASLQIIEQAIEKAGTLNRAKLRDTIAAETFQTVIGPVKFENGFNIYSPGEIGQWQNGEFEIIASKEKRTAKPIFPKPRWNSKKFKNNSINNGKSAEAVTSQRKQNRSDK